MIDVYIAVILNRGPHGPPGGIYKSWGGGEYRAFGELGRNGPLRGNQQIAINRPGCSSGWHIVAASPVIFDVTL